MRTASRAIAYFPGTLRLDDPAVADELFMQLYSRPEHSTVEGGQAIDNDFTIAFLRPLIPTLAIGGDTTWINRQRDGFSTRKGFASTYVLVKSLGALAIVRANLLLRPLALKINRQPLRNTEVETQYCCSVVCRSDDEAHVRALLLYAVNNTAITLRALDSEDLDSSNKVRVQANLIMSDRNDALLEQVVSRLSLEPGVSAVSWQISSDDTT